MGCCCSSEILFGEDVRRASRGHDLQRLRSGIGTAMPPPLKKSSHDDGTGGDGEIMCSVLSFPAAEEDDDKLADFADPSSSSLHPSSRSTMMMAKRGEHDSFCSLASVNRFADSVTRRSSLPTHAAVDAAEKQQRKRIWLVYRSSMKTLRNALEVASAAIRTREESNKKTSCSSQQLTLDQPPPVCTASAATQKAMRSPLLLSCGLEPLPPTIMSRPITTTITIMPRELMQLSPRSISSSAPSKATIYHDFDFFAHPDAAEILSRGDTLFAFMCKPFDAVGASEIAALRRCINSTCFSNEISENNTPIVNFDAHGDHAKCTVMMLKSMFIIPHLDPSVITQELISSVAYQKACQPGKPRIWEVIPNYSAPNTFRFTKSLIKYIYSITIQFRVSEITSDDEFDAFSVIDKIKPTKILRMERTKRDITYVDSMVKVRHFFLYYAVPEGGLLVCQQTMVLLSSLPRIITSVVHNFGGQGSVEAAEAATLQRGYFASLGK